MVNSRRFIKTFCRLLVIITLASLMMPGLAPKAAAASSQGFQVLSGQPQLGMIMSLAKNQGVVEPADTVNAASLVGVVAPNNGNFDQSPGQINVQTDGETDALVSTLGGNVIVGDKITASALQGVGAKLNGDGWVVGTAQASLDASTSGAQATWVTDSHGTKHRVYVALVPIAVHVTYYYTSANTGVVPVALQQLANNIAGKNVSLPVLIISVLIFLMGFIVAVAIIFSATRNGFLAISRQPLAKHVILKEERQSFAMATGILAGTVIICILLLRLV